MHQLSSTSSATHINAGSFGLWLKQARDALRGNGGMDVPCGECVGCCTSSYSILLRPHDTALDIVPVQFLSGVRGMAYPHAKMNPLENGHCPMFKAGCCSIYSMRPQTCLDYDCRIFAAAGIDAGETRPIINKRINEWQFDYASAEDRDAHEAIKAAAAFITKHTKSFPTEHAFTNPSAIAVLSIKVYELFVGLVHIQDEVSFITRIIEASRKFDAMF